MNSNGQFDYACEETLIIHRPRKEVYLALHNMKCWPEYLPHVKNIDVIYDDGKYQEFLMEVLSEQGDLLKVRSIRKCIQESLILFFQPIPPEFLQHHTGGWKLIELDHSNCEVITYHKWNLRDDIAKKKFPSSTGISTQQQVKNLLRNHAKLALETWKNVLEVNS